MSKIALEPNAAGTGTFSIASPATNTNRTLTLPDETGTVLTSVSAIPAAQITGLSGGMVYDLLGTIPTTSGSSVTLSGLDLTGYKQLQFFLQGVSGTLDTASYLNLNGWPVSYTNINGVTNNATGSGIIDLASGIFSSCTAVVYSTVIGSYGGGGLSGLTTASTNITFTISAGTFDAGSIIVYGVA